MSCKTVDKLWLLITVKRDILKKRAALPEFLRRCRLVLRLTIKRRFVRRERLVRLNMSMSKYWCFTLNNYTEEEEKAFWDCARWTYIVIGKESGGETMTPHLQGYVELNTRVRLSTLKKLSSRAHWEVRRSTGLKASEYCKKDGNWKEQGSLSINAVTERQSTKELVALAKEKNMRQIMEDPPNLSGIRLIEKYLTYCEPYRKQKPKVIWLHGETGSGKSQLAHFICCEIFGEDEVYWKDGEKWWDGYDRHDAIIIDDFRASNMRFNYLLRVLDRYPMRVEVKGGYRQLSGKIIIITSIKSADNAYQLDDEPKKQLIRRIDYEAEVNIWSVEAIKEKIRELCACAQAGGNTVHLPEGELGVCVTTRLPIDDDL